MVDDPRLVADPSEEPAFVTRAPSGRAVEVVDRKTYDRVTGLLADRLREAVEHLESYDEDQRLREEAGG